MLKIYLDHNIISNLKRENYRSYLDTILKYRDYFIFPYSEAHFQDLIKSFTPSNEKLFFQDIATYTNICQTHLLEYRADIDMVYPYRVTPAEYFKCNKDWLQCYNEGVYGEGVLKLIAKITNDDEVLYGVKTLLKSCPAPSQTLPGSDKLYTNLYDYFLDGMDHFAKAFTSPKTEKEIFDKAREGTTEELLSKLKSQKEVDIINFIEENITDQNGDSLFELTEKKLRSQKSYNDKNQFICRYLCLALLRYCRREKHHSLQNIYNDALHAYYASHCDIFVTEDDNLTVKAKALFKERGALTIIMTINELYDFIEGEVKNEFDYNHIFQNLLPKHGLPCSRIGQNLVYKCLPSPAFGYFNYCAIRKINRKKHITFWRGLGCRDAIFYTETDRLFLFMKNCFPEINKEFQEKFIDKFNSEDEEVAGTARFAFNVDKWFCLLAPNPMLSPSLPALYIAEQ